MGRKATSFKLIDGTRPSGEKYWLVRGTLHREQVRQEFSDRGAALTFLEQKNAELFGRATDRVPVSTHLAPEKVREAEVAHAQLERQSPGASLIDAAEFHVRF